MNVPKLRFKEFNDESYRKDILKNIISYIADNRGKNPDYYLDSGIPVIDNFMIQNQGYPDLSRANRYIDDNIYENFIRKAIEYNDTLITLVGNGIGNICLTPKEKCVIIQNTLGLRTNKFNDKKYLYHLLTYKNSEIKKLDRGMAQPSIRQDELLKLEVTIPNINEQLKISNFLSLLDKKIELQSKKIEDLKLFKKGLINKVINELTFYKKIELSELGVTYTGLTGKTKEDFENGESRYIPFVDILNNKINIDILPLVNIKKNEIQNKVRKYDLFFNTSSETVNEVGLCTTLNFDIENTYLNSFCFGYRINDVNKINNEYLNILLHSNIYRKKISILGQGFTRVNISKNKLMKIKVLIPSYKKQLEIVDVINIENNKILLEESKLYKLQKLKKGLMQSMFV